MSFVYAEVEDVAIAWRSIPAPPSDEYTKVEYLIEVASAIIRKSFPSMSDRLASGDEPDLGLLLKAVVVDMIVSVLRNPKGIRQATTGPTSVTLDASAASGRLSLTGEQFDLLSAVPRGGGLLGTIYIGVPNPYVRKARDIDVE